MMMQKRMTGKLEGEFVVFLIGMRGQPLVEAVAAGCASALAMPRMIKELVAHPELGFLGAEQWFGRTTIMVQYWRSTEELMDYAKRRDSEHLPAWSASTSSSAPTATSASGTRPTACIRRLRERLRQHDAVRARQGRRAGRGRARHASGKTKTRLANGEASVSGA